MRKWTTEEQNFFFGILTQARDKGTEMLVFDKEDLKEFANYTDRHNKNFKTTMRSLINKLDNIKYREETNNSLKSIALFQWLEAEWTEDYSDIRLEIQLSSKYEYILNKLDANFTQFELKQFLNIKSSYAKEMFKKLKQWRTIGKKKYDVEEFRKMLDVPKSYRATDINKVILIPVIEELSEYFIGLKVKPIKAKKQGNPIIAYEFTWKAEMTQQWIEGKYNKEKYPKRKHAKKVEKLPEWGKDDYVAPEEKPVAPETKEHFNDRLKKFREKDIQSK